MVSTFTTRIGAPLALSFLLGSCVAGRAMEFTSPDVTNGAKLALSQVHTRCGGENRSPALRWSGAPAGTKSFAVTLFDPDAGRGTGFWHWLVFDIPAATTNLAQAAGTADGLPAGTQQAVNGFGEAGYGGACPPSGSGLHHYAFTLYALGTPRLPFGADVKNADLAIYLRAHALATASLIATYSR
jgi:hypothetical protein